MLRTTILVALLLVQAMAWAQEPVLRQPVPGVHAVTGVTVVTAPGEVIENGAIVVRDGIIESVGADIEIPADALVHEFDPEEAEVRIYPGMIDAYVPVPFVSDSEEGQGGEDEEAVTLRPGQYPHPLVTPARRLSSGHWPADKVAGLRRAGFTTAVMAPDSGLFRGYSALVNLGEGGLADNLIEPSMFQHVSLGATISGREFPNSRMGTMALVRQVMLDARWQVEARTAWSRNPAQPRPTYLEDIEALEPLVEGDRMMVVDASDMLDSLRAARVSAEFELRPWLVGHGREYQRLESLAETGLGQILPLDFPEAPDLEQSRRDIGLPELRHWHVAPENPLRVIEAGLPVVFTSHPHGNPEAIFANLARAIERGLDSDAALAALTTEPARMLGIDDRAGRLAPGYMANFLIVEDELFVESPALREVWIDGRQHILRELEPPEVEPAGSWDLSLIVTGMGNIDAVLELQGESPTLSGSLEVMGSSVPLAEARVSGSRLDVRIDGSRLGMPGAITFYMDIEGERGRGSGSSPQGEFDVRGQRSSGPDEAEGTA